MFPELSTQLCPGLAPPGKGMVLDPLQRGGSTAEPTTLNLQLLRMGRTSPGTQTPRCFWWLIPNQLGYHESRQTQDILWRVGEGSEQPVALQLDTGEMFESTLTQETNKHLCNNPGH